jgi:hypothetical protein
MVQHPAIGYGMLTINILTLLIVAYQLFLASSLRFRLIFISANLFMLLVMIALIADRMINS